MKDFGRCFCLRTKQYQFLVRVNKEHLQPSSHGLHAVPVPGVFVRDHADLHQERYQDSLPEKGKDTNQCRTGSVLSVSFDTHQKETKTTSLTQRNLPTGLMGVSSSLRARYSSTRQYMAN